MLIKILEENNNCELIFSIELPNIRAKKYIKKVLKDCGKDSLEEDALEEALLRAFQEEWMAEAQRRLDYNFMPDFYRINNFKTKGKGHPIYFECIAFFNKALEKEHYRDFEFELRLPHLNKELDLKIRIEETFYQLAEHHLSDGNVKPPNKMKAEIIVLDKNSGEELEDLSESFFDFVERGTFPDPVLQALKNYKAGDSLEVELNVDEVNDDWLQDRYPGHTLVYRIKINEVYREVVPQPPYTDGLAQKLGYKNLEEVTKQAKERQEFYEGNIYKHQLLKQYLAKVAENLEFKPTENMIFAKKLAMGIIGGDGSPFTDDHTLNSDEFIKKEIFEDILAPRIFNAEGMLMDEDRLIRAVLERSNDDLDREELDERVTKLAYGKTLEWLELNIEKLITVKSKKVEDNSMLYFT